MPEAEASEKGHQAPKTQAPTSAQNQYVPDKTLRRVAIEKADRTEENKK